MTSSNPQSMTAEQSDVRTTLRDDYDDTEEIVAALDHQETFSPLNPSNCCDAGDHSFSVNKTPLPKIHSEDLQEGLLVYRPMTSPLKVFEVLSEPFTSEYGFREVKVRSHSKSHDGDDPKYRSDTRTVFCSMILDEFTFLQPQTVQQTLPGIQ